MDKNGTLFISIGELICCWTSGPRTRPDNVASNVNCYLNGPGFTVPMHRCKSWWSDVSTGRGNLAPGFCAHEMLGSWTTWMAKWNQFGQTSMSGSVSQPFRDKIQRVPNMNSVFNRTQCADMLREADMSCYGRLTPRLSRSRHMVELRHPDIHNCTRCRHCWNKMRIIVTMMGSPPLTCRHMMSTSSYDDLRRNHLETKKHTSETIQIP